MVVQGLFRRVVAQGRARAGQPWVYPRVCGGTIAKKRAMVDAAGLSPRVRGNPVAVADEAHLEGSIPACAGEPTQHHALRRQRKVYPRVCGGTIIATKMSGSNLGLSPRVRGNHSQEASDG